MSDRRPKVLDEQVGDSTDRRDFWEVFEAAKKFRPEQKLMAAILKGAADAYLDTDKRKRKLYQEAAEWIFEEENDWLFSFRSVCLHLDLNPDYVAGLLARRRYLREQEVIEKNREVKKRKKK